MKKIVGVLSIALICASLVFVAGCGGDTPSDGMPPVPVDGITFSDASFDYDGIEHVIEASGVPSGVSVTYSGNKGTNAGTYNAKAELSAEGYKTVTLSATLTINKIDYDMSNAAWDYSGAFTYDGQSHSVVVVGLPDGVTVESYTDNVAVDAGSYTASVELDYDEINHNAPTVEACEWTINKAVISAELTFADTTVEYDTFEHGIALVGNVPSGVTAKYYYDGEERDGVSAVGEYEVRCELSGKNYVTKTLTATLKITSTEKLLFSAVADGRVYFQNDLDGDKLYAVSGNGVVKASNDIPNHMIESGGKLYYFGTSMFSKVIKMYNGSAATTLYSQGGEYLASDGTYLYYAVNKLLPSDGNGIFRVRLDGSTETPEKLTSDKAEYLVCVGGYIYYADKSEGDKLYRVRTDASDEKGISVHDEKTEYVVTDGTDVYFTATKEIAGVVGVASAIYKFDVSENRTVKLTTDNGKYLTVVGNDIYYVNADKITTAIFGKGIYKVSANKTSDSSLPGEKVCEASDGDGYSSLASDGTNLYYYRLSTKKFYKNSASGDNEVDLMANFTVSDDATLSGYSRVVEYEGEIYYTDPRDGGCLYKYNPTTRAKFKVLADSVSYVAFHADGARKYMYYSTYVLTNYAFFRLDMKTGETVKISSDRIENITFDGDRMYCLRVGASLTNYIISMDLDGGDRQTVTDGHISSKNLVKVGDTYYFISGTSLTGTNVSKYTVGDSKITTLYKADYFAISGDKLYFRCNSKDGGIAAKTLNVCNLDGSGVSTVKTNVDVTYMCAIDGKLYYSAGDGFYVYDGTADKKICDRPASGVAVYDGKVYFLQSEVTLTNDYPTQDASCDGKLYCYDGTTVRAV